MKVIDDQFHMIPPDYQKALEQKGIGFVGGGRSKWPEWNPEQAMELMDRNGIDMAIGCLSEPGVYFNGDREWAAELSRMYNEYCADLVRRYPDRFRCMGTLPMPSVGYSIREIDYIFDTLKLSAVVLLSNIQGEYLGNPKFDPVFEALNRHQATVFIHPTIPPAGSRSTVEVPPWVLDFVFDTTRTVTDLLIHGTLEKYPDITFVLAHCGGTVPYLAQRLESLRIATEQTMPHIQKNVPKGMSHYLQKMYFSTELTYDPAVFALLERFAGYRHILSGSDYPFAAETFVRGNMQAVKNYFGNNEAVWADIAGGNAARVYKNM